MTAPSQTTTGHPRKWWILIAVSLGMILGLLDISVVNIAIPALIRDLHTTVGGVSWVLNAYNIAQAVLLLSFGRLADRYGQRLMFVASLALFTLASLACGLAGSIEQLVAFRIIQAIGAAGMVPISLIILLGAFPSYQHGLATGLWASIGTVAAIAGPPVGGLLIEYASWHWIFFMNVPVGIAAVVMALLLVPEIRRDTKSASLDLPGIALSTAALFCLTLAIVQGNTWRWGSPVIVSLLVAAVVLVGLFLLWEHRFRSPMFELSLFKIRAFSSSNAMGVIGGVGMGGVTLLMVLFMVNVLGYNELWAAIGMIPAAFTSMVLTPFSGRLVDRLGPRQLAAAGTVLFAVAFALFSQMRADSTIWDIAWRGVIMGTAMSLHMPALTAAGMTSLPSRSSGVGSGMISMGRQVGAVIGVALLLSIYGQTAWQGAENAAERATAYVTAQERLEPSIREEIVAIVTETTREHAATAAAGSFDLGPPVAAALGGRVDSGTLAAISADLTALTDDEQSKAFLWPFLIPGIVALLGLPLAFLLGRRLGEHRVAE